MSGAGFHNAGFWLRFPAAGNGFIRTRTKSAAFTVTHLWLLLGGRFPGGQKRQSGRQIVSLGLLLLDFQIQDDVLAAIKGGNRTCSGLGAFFFRMEFVIGVRVQAAESITAGVICVAAANRISA